MSSLVYEQEDTNMDDGTDTEYDNMKATAPTRRIGFDRPPSRSPDRALPLTSYVGPPIAPRVPSRRTRQAPAPAPGPDAFFPSFPEPICFCMGCHRLAPHTHADGQHTGRDANLPTGEALRQQYEAVEVQVARQDLSNRLRATPRYASLPPRSSILPPPLLTPPQTFPESSRCRGGAP